MFWTTVILYASYLSALLQFLLMVLAVPFLWLGIKALRKYLNS